MSHQQTSWPNMPVFGYLGLLGASWRSLQAITVHPFKLGPTIATTRHLCVVWSQEEWCVGGGIPPLLVACIMVAPCQYGHSVGLSRLTHGTFGFFRTCTGGMVGRMAWQFYSIYTTVFINTSKADLRFTSNFLIPLLLHNVLLKFFLINEHSLWMKHFCGSHTFLFYKAFPMFIFVLSQIFSKI